jgi:Transglycosylase SLT domain
MKYRVIGFGLLMILFGANVCVAQDAETLKRASAYEPLMIAAAKRHGVDPRLLWTVAFLETRFQPDQVSSAGARGMMQFMPATARRFGLGDPHEPAASIDAAARYLRELQIMFDYRLDLVLAAYNSGELAVTAFKEGRSLALSNGKILNPRGVKTGGVPPYRETVNYVVSGVRLFKKLVSEDRLFALRPTELRLVDEREEEGLITVVLEESLPEEAAELKKGSLYVVSSHTPIPPKVSTTGSIYPR